MGIIFKIAWRNIWRHRGKSIVVGLILFLGSLLMTVGNGMISGMERGFSENIVNSFTGDIVIISNEQTKNEVFFDFSGKPLKVIKDYPRIEALLRKNYGTQKWMPAAAGLVMVLNSESDMGEVMLLGVDIQRYRQFFPHNIVVTEGRNLQPGRPGLLVSEEARKQFYDKMNYWVLPAAGKLLREKLPEEAKRKQAQLDIRNEVVFMGLSTSNSGSDVKVPVRGVIKFKSFNKLWGYYCIVDLDSFRQAHNYLTGTDGQSPIADEQKRLLASDNLDDYFGAAQLETQTVSTRGKKLAVEPIVQLAPPKLAVDDGTYNLIFLRLSKDGALDQTLAELNRQFTRNHLKVKAVSWKEALGLFGGMAAIIKTGLNLFIFFLFLVASMIMMNTLSMVAMERVSEIGMMRAIGAQKGWLRRMYLYETGILAFFCGGCGMLAGFLVIGIMQGANVTTMNEIMQMVYGGDRLNPLLTLGDIGSGVVELAIVTLLSAGYPLRVIRRITPLDAVTP